MVGKGCLTYMNHAAAAILILEGVCRTTMGFMLHACYGVFGQRRGIGGLRAQGSVRASLNFCKENRYICQSRCSWKVYVPRFPSSNQSTLENWKIGKFPGLTRLDQRVRFVDVSHCFYRQRRCCMSPIKTMARLQGAGLVGRCRKARLFSRPIKRWEGVLTTLRCGDWYYVVGEEHQ